MLYNEYLRYRYGNGHQDGTVHRPLTQKNCSNTTFTRRRGIAGEALILSASQKLRET